MRDRGRNRTRATFIVLTAALAGCEGRIEAPTAPEVFHNSERTVQVITANGLPPGTLAWNSAAWDWTTGLEIQIAHCKTPHWGENLQLGCDVDDPYVLVGGGAWAEFGSPVGALLTGSWPGNDGRYKTWCASSKDHIEAQYHWLHVYAIGLKVSGLSRADLAARMTMTESTGWQQSHPWATVGPPAGYQLIGGGARVNYSGWGSLLVESYPQPGAWYASSKDHVWGDPATVTAFAIGYKNDPIPNLGTLDIRTRSGNGTYVDTGVAVSPKDIEGHCLVTSIGGKSEYNGPGRLLFKMAPTDWANTRQIQASSKDHLQVSSGNTTGYYIEVCKY
jgi:hypothetical protein